MRCVELLLPPIEVRKNLTERQNSPRTRWHTGVSLLILSVIKFAISIEE